MLKHAKKVKKLFSWCGACKSLKPKFAADKQIELMSEKFNMVSLNNPLKIE
jgi:thiol-disulfide isomerase/thioredoxin